MHTIRKRKINTYLALLLPLVITTLFWYNAKSVRGIELRFSQSAVYISQLLGLWGIVLLSMSYFMATRLKVIEVFYGGLDKVYKLHSKIGKVAFLFILLHPILLAANRIADLGFVKSLFIPGATFPKTMGITGLYLYIVLILITIFRFLPYRLWKHTHQLMGIPFFFAAIHALYAESDVKNEQYLRYWILLWIIIGVVSYIYKVFLYKYIGQHFAYTISEVRTNGTIKELYMKPHGRRLNFEPGEFVFISFTNNEGISSEHHPFSISSSPAKDTLRISYKEVGDYTKSLAHAHTGDTVQIYGPYGEFSSYVFDEYKKQIWIAGGIGITPFLSMLSYEAFNEDKKEIHFYHCEKNQSDHVYHEEILNEVKKSDDSITFCDHCSSECGYLTAKKIQENINGLEGYLILLCGPVPMMRNLKHQFIELGVSADMIVFEEFNLV
jgi:predicted ferric reductase